MICLSLLVIVNVSVAKGYDEDHLLENDESREYHIERHNHYMELFALKGIDAIGIIE